mgnify:CR=1 FL=1
MVVVFHCADGCGFLATFEHPLTEKQYQDYLEKWNGHRIEDYSIAETEDRQAMLERLEALGYVTRGMGNGGRSNV